MVALTGAGCSTESGIPDYRGPGTAQRARNPIQYHEFMSSASVRRRYWARSFVGWPRMAEARPNRAHRALAAMEQAGVLRGIITQNVDRLHHSAGSQRVIELHGALAEVRCMDCSHIESRHSLQARLAALNPDWSVHGVEQAPDGDAELAGEMVQRFRVPGCVACSGPLKPHVVFFGENVPRPVVDRAWALLDEAEVLLVVGSSLTVFSGFRFVRRAAERNLPVAILNLGPTRGDALAQLRVDAQAGQLLPRLVDLLIPPGTQAPAMRATSA